MGESEKIRKNKSCYSDFIEKVILQGKIGNATSIMGTYSFTPLI